VATLKYLNGIRPSLKTKQLQALIDRTSSAPGWNSATRHKPNILFSLDAALVRLHQAPSKQQTHAQQRSVSKGVLRTPACTCIDNPWASTSLSAACRAARLKRKNEIKVSAILKTLPETAITRWSSCNELAHLREERATTKSFYQACQHMEAGTITSWSWICVLFLTLRG